MPRERTNFYMSYNNIMSVININSIGVKKNCNFAKFIKKIVIMQGEKSQLLDESFSQLRIIYPLAH